MMKQKRKKRLQVSTHYHVHLVYCDHHGSTHSFYILTHNTYKKNCRYDLKYKQTKIE